jgi:hypothetical protein
MGQQASRVELRPRYTYPSGNSYEGEWKGQKRHGQGRYTWPDGTAYEGQWLDNAQHGQGKLFFTNGTSVEGFFVQNQLHGQACLTTNEGSTFQGEWNFVRRRPGGGGQAALSDYYVNVQITSVGSDTSTAYTGHATLDLHTGDCSLARTSYGAGVYGAQEISTAQVVQAQAMPPAQAVFADSTSALPQTQTGQNTVAPQQAVPVASLATEAAFAPEGSNIPVARPVMD